MIHNDAKNFEGEAPDLPSLKMNQDKRLRQIS